jgi:4'-phosphopantetheinyl transferase
MTYVNYTDVPSDMPDAMFRAYLSRLPSVLHPQILNYQRTTKRNCSLFGKLLLTDLLQKNNIIPESWGYLSTHFGKPIQDNAWYFSISHAQNWVICVLTQQSKIGIDLEFTREINLNPLEILFDKIEWQQILNAVSPKHQLTMLWTQKEAVSKASGTGLPDDLSSIKVVDDGVFYLEKKWFLKQISLPDIPEGIINIATTQPIMALEIERIRLVT